jgi:hypothetical protein
MSKAVAGRPFTAWMLVTNADTGQGVKGQVTCQGKLSGKSLRAKSKSSSSSGRSSCTWQLPVTARGKRFNGSITARFERSVASRSFSIKVR